MTTHRGKSHCERGSTIGVDYGFQRHQTEFWGHCSRTATGRSRCLCEHRFLRVGAAGADIVGAGWFLMMMQLFFDVFLFENLIYLLEK